MNLAKIIAFVHKFCTRVTGHRHRCCYSRATDKHVLQLTPFISEHDTQQHTHISDVVHKQLIDKSKQIRNIFPSKLRKQ